ncbi:MAG: ISAs1 family transposase, partial [Selenomonadaceae bacterium]|nr:ISAs1 family transposase [Selenomonadaceae bacterium]
MNTRARKNSRENKRNSDISRNAGNFERKRKNNHGRIEKRICKKMTDTEWLKERYNWSGLKNVFAVENIISTAKKTTQETGYYISSLKADEEKFLSVVSEHWKIESMHRILDAVFGENYCDFQSEQAHITINIFRKFAIALHKKYL